MPLLSNKRNLVMEYAFLVIGIFLLAGGLSIFFEPNQLVVGGFSGLAIIIEHYTKLWFGWGLPVSATNIILNLPLFFLAWKMLGKGTLGRTIFATLLYSVALEVLKYVPVYEGELMLAAIYGGVLSGAGLGCILRGYATTGGTDLLATIVHKLVPALPVSKLLFAFDAAIIGLGFFIFGAERAMYAVIAVFISSKLISAILEGMSFSKAAFIISENSEAIAKRLLIEADRGVTALHGRGMYTGKERDVLFCVFSQKDITQVKEIVREVDPLAFVMVSDVKEVLGEGFQAMES